VKLSWRSTKPDANRDDPNRYEFLTKLLDRNARWIEVADAKAGAVLVFTSAGVKALATPVVTAVQRVTAQPLVGLTVIVGALSVVFLLLVAVAAVSSLVALISCFLILNPRLARPRQPGSIYFGDIAHRDLVDVEKKMALLTGEEINADLVEQVYTTSHIALQKHRHVRRAITSVFCATGSGLLLYLLSFQYV
jgi:hypothetical protein